MTVRVVSVRKKEKRKMPEGRKFSTWGYVKLFGVWGGRTNV